MLQKATQSLPLAVLSDISHKEAMLSALRCRPAAMLGSTAIRGQWLTFPGGRLWGLKPSPLRREQPLQKLLQGTVFGHIVVSCHPFPSVLTGTTLRLRQDSKLISSGRYRRCKLKKKQVKRRSPDKQELGFDELQPLLRYSGLP